MTAKKSKQLGLSEFSSAGTPPNEAMEVRRQGLAERAGKTGSYVDPEKEYTEPSVPTQEYEADRAAAEREVRARRIFGDIEIIDGGQP